MTRKLFGAILPLLVGAASLAAGQAPVYTLLWSPGSLDTPGGQPTAIFEAAPGLFYVLGVTDQSTFGPSVFSITSTGTYKLIYSLEPYAESAALAQGTDGRIYVPGFLRLEDTTAYNYYTSLDLSGQDPQEYAIPGDWGTIWQIIAAPGELYDMVGSNNPLKVFGFARISETGQITVLHQFAASDGAVSGANLALGSDNNFYGVGNQRQGETSPGFIFRLTPDGQYSHLLNFPSFPTSGFLQLISASDGSLYGLFGAGGPSNSGELYRATLTGDLQTVATFPPDMRAPQTLMQASDGNIYGSTNPSTNFPSAIFRYDMKTHALTTAFRFADFGTQGLCYCQLIQGMDGKIYGVTGNGGPWPGNGAVFSLDLGLPRPKPAVTALYPSTGSVGQEVMLWGKYLLAATAVTFNGTPASSIHVTSGLSVSAAVPPGATSGPVTVTTPNGSFTTSESFTVQ